MKKIIGSIQERIHECLRKDKTILPLLTLKYYKHHNLNPYRELIYPIRLMVELGSIEKSTIDDTFTIEFIFKLKKASDFEKPGDMDIIGRIISMINLDLFKEYSGTEFYILNFNFKVKNV